MCSDQTNSFLTSVNCVSKNKHQLSRKTSMIPSWRTSSSVVVRKLLICRNQNLIKISMAIKKIMDLVWIGLGVKSKSSLSSSLSLFKYHSRLLQNSTRRVSTRRCSLSRTHEKVFPSKKAIPSKVSALDYQVY